MSFNNTIHTHIHKLTSTSLCLKAVNSRYIIQTNLTVFYDYGEPLSITPTITSCVRACVCECVYSVYIHGHAYLIHGRG